LIVAAIGLLVTALFMTFWGITSVGRWAGGRFEPERWIRVLLDKGVGIERMQEFRDDMTEVVRRNHDSLYDVDMTIPELRSESERLREQAGHDLQKGDFIIAIGAGLLSLVLSAIPSLLSLTSIPLSGVPVLWFFGVLVTVYAVLTTFLLTIRVVVTEILVYPQAEFENRENRKPTAVPMYIWNKAILTSYQTQAGTIVIGLLRRFTPGGYEITMDKIDELLEDDMDNVDLVKYVLRLIGSTIIKNTGRLPTEEPNEDPE